MRDEGGLAKSENISTNNFCDFVHFYGFKCHLLTDDFKGTHTAWTSSMIPDSYIKCACWIRAFWCLLGIPVEQNPWFYRSHLPRRHQACSSDSLLFSVIDHPTLLIAKHLIVILDAFLLHSATTPSASAVGLTITEWIIDPICTLIQAIILSHMDHCYFQRVCLLSATVVSWVCSLVLHNKLLPM